MATKKGLSMKLAIVGIDEYQDALEDVNLAFEHLKTAAEGLQKATARLDEVEIKVIRE